MVPRNSVNSLLLNTLACRAFLVPYRGVVLFLYSSIALDSSAGGEVAMASRVSFWKLEVSSRELSRKYREERQPF